MSQFSSLDLENFDKEETIDADFLAMVGWIPLDNIIPASPTGPPFRENFPGEYNFNLEINGAYTKKNKYVYSHKLHRIYVDMKENFSVNFNWNTLNLQNPMYVRATVVFSDSAQAEKRVERCSQHFYDKNNMQPISEAERHNILRSARASGSPEVFYCGEPSINNSWYSVLVLLRAPTSLAYNFVCKSSCSSGINRRAISIIFTLEDMTGIVHGRQSVGVRVCSCPLRDMRRDEGDEPTPGKRKLSRPEPSVNSPSTKVIKTEPRKLEEPVNVPVNQISLVTPHIAVTGLNVMYEMTKSLRDERLHHQQPVEELERALVNIQCEIDRMKNKA